MASLSTGEIVRGTLAAMRPQLWTLVAIAAPFTLLVEMALTLFGPAPPRDVAGFTPRVVVLLIVLPGIISAVAQLAVAHMVARPGAAPRDALAAGFARTPAYLAAVMITALPLSFILAPLFVLVPVSLAAVVITVAALVLLSRLFIAVPLAAIEGLGPIALVRRSWQLSGRAPWTILGFIVIAMLALVAAGIVTGGVSAALGSLLTLAGLKPVGSFAAALVSASVNALFSIAGAVAATVIYLKLVQEPPAGA